MMSEDQEYRSDRVAEALASYVRAIPAYALKERGLTHLSMTEFFKDRMLVVRVIRQGISHRLFMSIKEMAPFSDQEWSQFLDISLKSLQRYKKDEAHIFNVLHSEKIIELAEVTSVGQAVFDSAEQFGLWLNAPSHALGGLMPLELLQDSYGKELVMNELSRIDQGIFV